MKGLNRLPEALQKRGPRRSRVSDEELCLAGGLALDYPAKLASLSIEELEARVLGYSLAEYQLQQLLHGRREMSILASIEVQMIASGGA